jgi:predicted nucleic acid-binding protein
MPQAECARALTRCLALPDELADDASLCREAFALACQAQRNAYDSLYLVLARREAATFLTMDAPLRRTALDFAIAVD